MRTNRTVTISTKLLTILLLSFASHFNMSAQSPNKYLHPIETPLVGLSVIPIHTFTYTRLLFDFGSPPFIFYYLDVPFSPGGDRPMVYYVYMEDLGEVLMSLIYNPYLTPLYKVDFKTFEKKEVELSVDDSAWIIDYDDATGQVKAIYGRLVDDRENFMKEHIKVMSPDASEFRSLLLEYKRNRSTR